MISHDNSDPDLTAFWADMAHRLFWNVNILYEQIETQYADRSPEEGPGAQMAVSPIGTSGLTFYRLMRSSNRHFVCTRAAFWPVMRANSRTASPGIPQTPRAAETNVLQSAPTQLWGAKPP